MSALVAIGLRLTRAGGRFRYLAIVIGNAVGVLVLLGALAVPAAVYPPGMEIDAYKRTQLVAIVAVLVVPVAILLLTVGRLSSGVRDQRLASLRLLGLSPGRTLAVAGIENAALALPGALLGGLGFFAAAPLVDHLVARGPDWFVEPLGVRWTTWVLTVLAVVSISVLVSVAPMRGLRADPRAARAESTKRTPSLWRLALLLVAFAVLLWVRSVDMESTNLPINAVIWVMLAGALLGALAIALVGPLLGFWGARLLIRTRTVAGVLGGRSIQTEPGAAGRMVSGIAVTVYVVIAAATMLSAYQSTPQYEFAAQTIGDGPQTIAVWALPDANGDTPPLNEEDIAELQGLLDVPGVQSVMPAHQPLSVVGCDPMATDSCYLRVMVGTCAQLAERAAVRGCRDDVAAMISATHVPDDSWAFIGDDPAEILGESVTLTPETSEGSTGSATLELPLAPEPIIEDVSATMERWVYPSQIGVFVPVSLVQDFVGPPTSVEVIADGGFPVREALEQFGIDHGFDVWLYPLWDYDQVMRVRAVVWTLSGIAVGVGLLSLALTSIDRTLERRRAVARQIAVGVPVNVLRTGQLLQTIVPLTAALALAALCGRVLVEAFSNLQGIDLAPAPEAMFAFFLATAIGVLLVSACTMPLIRTKIRPEQLRRE